MVTFLTVLKYGSTEKTRLGYKPEHVYAIQNQIKKHYKKPHKFFCLTDHENLKCPTIKLLHNWPGWWSKLELFRFNFSPEETIVYIDLDTVILSDITTLVDYPHKFSALAEALPQGITDNLGSGIMIWTGAQIDIYNKFKEGAAHFMNIHRAHGDQAFIQEMRPGFMKLQDKFCGLYSYKFTLQDKDNPPVDTKIIYFSGKPKPWQADVNHSWINKNDYL